jgi:hypothetical protein
MVKGPCRGKMCDFWTRVKLRKLHIDEVVEELRNSIIGCDDEIGSDLDKAFTQFWRDFGIRDLRRFCEEDPELCSKMKDAEEQIRMQMF